MCVAPAEETLNWTNQRNVAVKDDAVVTGEIIANIDLTHNAQVIHPPVVSN